jgi:glutathione S-transferase
MSSHPDSNLHPVATGLAKHIVDAHQKEEPLKLYSGWLYV